MYINVYVCTIVATWFLIYMFIHVHYLMSSSYNTTSTCMCVSSVCYLPALGVYGDIVRVKILYNKRDSALIQFKEPQHAQTGRTRIYAMVHTRLVNYVPF